MKRRLTQLDKQEYATKLTLIGIFLSLFTVFASRLGFWRSKNPVVELRPFDLALLGLSTLRLGRMVSYDLVTEPLRRPFTRTVPDESGAGKTVAPRETTGIHRSIGQLLSCPICAGTWIAAGLVYGLHALPRATRLFLAIMGTTGLAEVLNALTEALEWSGQLARNQSWPATRPEK